MCIEQQPTTDQTSCSLGLAVAACSCSYLCFPSLSFSSIPVMFSLLFFSCTLFASIFRPYLPIVTLYAMSCIPLPFPPLCLPPSLLPTSSFPPPTLPASPFLPPFVFPSLPPSLMPGSCCLLFLCWGVLPQRWLFSHLSCQFAGQPYSGV